MEILKGACIIGQSGGPTAVINASAQGVIQTALANPNITRVLGAAHGIKGVLADKLYDMGQEDPAELDLLQFTPSSALGSCRYKLADPDVDDTDYQRILEIFKKYDVRYFFYNGGNDSMDTCNKISKYMQRVGYPCNVIGVPKTIDNDLSGTDHCPGYASAAKYIATSCMELYQDARVYDTGTIVVVEIMGRHAGWLAGAAALATWAGSGPDLVYLPEVDFDMDLCHRRLRPRPVGRPGSHVGRDHQAKNGCEGPGHRALPAPTLRLPFGLQNRHGRGLPGRQSRRGGRRLRHHRPHGGPGLPPGQQRLPLRNQAGPPVPGRQYRAEGAPGVDQPGGQRGGTGVHRLRPPPHPRGAPAACGTCPAPVFQTEKGPGLWGGLISGTGGAP